MIPPDAVVVAVDDAAAAAGCGGRVACVSDGSIFFNDALRHHIEENATKTIVVGDDLLHLGFCGNARRPEDEDPMAAKLLHQIGRASCRERVYISEVAA